MRKLLLIAVLALAFPANAFAHAALEQATPGFRERLPASPAKVTLRFDQYVKVLPGSIRLYSAKGSVGVTQVRSAGRVVEASLPRLPKGPYTVRWHVMSGDSHVVSGVFTFGGSTSSRSRSSSAA
jgi:copper transport protein